MSDVKKIVTVDMLSEFKTLNDKVMQAGDAVAIKNLATVGDNVYFFTTVDIPKTTEGAVDISKAVGFLSISSSAITALQQAVGDVTTLATDSKVVVGAINEVLSALKALKASEVAIDTIDGITASTVQAALEAIQAEYAAIDYTGKADKVASATNGNFAGLDANGNLTDSGKNADSFDIAGAAATAKSEVIGASTDAKTADTIYGAKAYAKDAADTVQANLDTTNANIGTGFDSTNTVAKAISDVADDLDDLSDLVGTLPAGATSQTVVAYAKEVADAVQGNTTETVASVDAKVEALGTAADADVAVVEIGTQDEATDALPTVAQVKKYVTDSVAKLEGAVHFRGKFEKLEDVTNPEAGDVVIIGVKEYIYDKEGNWVELGDESMFVAKTTTIAGVDLQDDITKTELLTALNVEDGAQVNIIEKIKVGETEQSITDKTITLGTAAGSAITDFDAAGAADAVQGSTTATVASVETDLNTFKATIAYAEKSDIEGLFSAE